MHHHLAAACADGVDDAAALFGAGDLGRKRLLVCTHTEEKERRAGEEQRKLTLSFCWRKMLACWSAFLMMRATNAAYGGDDAGWRRERKLIG
jgi:hypothetical protein